MRMLLGAGAGLVFGLAALWLVDRVLLALRKRRGNPDYD